MSRKEFPRKVKAAAIARAKGHCEKCKAVLKTGEADIDHILPCELGGEPVLANAQVICKSCHKAKTANDVRGMRKGERNRDKKSGAIRPKGNIQGTQFDRKPVKEKLAIPPRRSFYQEKSA